MTLCDWPACQTDALTDADKCDVHLDRYLRGEKPSDDEIYDYVENHLIGFSDGRDPETVAEEIDCEWSQSNGDNWDMHYVLCETCDFWIPAYEAVDYDGEPWEFCDNCCPDEDDWLAQKEKD